MAENVGIRQLRQNLSAYVRRVREGEHFVVTEHNRPVARLTPLEEDDPIARLIAEGKVRPAKGDILDHVPVFNAEESKGVWEAFQEQRRERLP